MVSIIGKVAHEKAMLSGPIPTRILGAAQFHEFVAQIVEWGRQGDVSYVPAMRTQLVAARTLADMAMLLAARSGDPVRIEGVNNAADPDQALYESGALLPGPNATLAGPTFEQWLEATYGARHQVSGQSLVV